MLPMETMCDVLTGCMSHTVMSLKEPEREAHSSGGGLSTLGASWGRASLRKSGEGVGEKGFHILAPCCTTFPITIEECLSLVIKI